MREFMKGKGRRDKRFDRPSPGREERFGRRPEREGDRDERGSRGRESFTAFRDRKQSRGRDFKRSGDMGKPEMHKAICDECGKVCEVPFMPSNSKPIYCSACYEKKQGKGDDRRRPSFDNRQRTGSRPGFRRGQESRESASNYDLDVINRKLDKIMKKLGIE
jgi:CxxC-x17-CxxC domain-containing protein